MIFAKSYISEVIYLIKKLNIKKPLIAFVLILYSSFSSFSTLLEGLGIVLIVSLISFGINDQYYNVENLPVFIKYFLSFFNLKETTLSKILIIIIIVYFINLLFKLSLVSFDGWLAANLRKKIQEKVFIHYLSCNWSETKSLRVGDMVNVITYEAWAVSKFLACSVSTIYFTISAIIMITLSVLTDLYIFLSFIIIISPIILFIRYLVFLQSRMSVKTANLRNKFSADITDRFNGLFQINTEKKTNYHIYKGTETQKQLTYIEFLMGIIHAGISSFNIFLPLICILIFYVWILYQGISEIPDIISSASIIVLGLKLSNYLSGLVGSIGQLARLSGSFVPVNKALNISSSNIKKQIKDKISEILISKLSHKLGKKKIFENFSLKLKTNRPILIKGKSGAGKTTLANLISGVLDPDKGKIEYIGENTKNKYDSRHYIPKIGYVTQDIYLFKDTIKNNLICGQAISEKKIWNVLDQVDATDFIKSAGGLGMQSLEAGRSLSGGQKRRLGIARVLLINSDILILDEITSGLDVINKKLISNLINKLSKNHIVICISHEKINLHNPNVISL